MQVYNAELKIAILKKYGYGGQRAFAKDVGIDQGYLSQIITGARNPSVEMQRKMAATLKKTQKELFGGNGNAIR